MSMGLASRGFVKQSHCTCGGDPKETWALYGRLNVFVEIRPQRDAFRVTSVYPPVKGTLNELMPKIDKLLRDMNPPR